MRTKLFFLVLIVSTLISTSIFAQPGGQRSTPEEMAKRQTENLTKELSLNEDQKTKVNAIFLESSKKRGEVFENNRDDRAKLREEMTKMRKAENEKINKVLTKEQQTKYAEYLKKREEARRNRRGQ